MDPPEDIELASLIEETRGDHVGNGNGRVPKRGRMDLRRPTSGRSNNNAATSTSPPQPHTIFGFSSRNALLLLNLAGVVLLLVIVASKTESAIETDAATTTFEAHHGHPTSNTDLSQADNKYIGFHDPSLENIYGSNRYYKPKGVGYPIAPRGGNHPIYMMEIGEEKKKSLLSNDDEYFDDDYERSPYADKRLNLTDEERTTEQKEWSKNLQDIRDKYGYWNFKDNYKEKNKKDRPVVDWATVGEKKKDYNPLLGEIDKDDFPEGTWQTDDEYIFNFLKEGKKLVRRVIDAIHDEYGMDDVSKQAGINIGEKHLGGNVGVAWMYEESFNALVTKLLNAMMTNDHFFFTLGGHSAAAGHGNNFHQSYVIEFQRVMEPVFDRLGMVLVSANRAQGGMGTLQAALAGVSVYGEKDFVLWDSSMTEKDGRAQDVFHRQALLSGQRVPILFDLGGGRGTMDRLHNEVGAHVGGVTKISLVPKHINATYLNEHKYNAKCWTDRVDIEPGVQNPGYGGQASWHPGNYVHQSTARKISLLFLHALDEALTQWNTTVSTEGNPLDGKHWHLHEEEEKIRNALKKANGTDTECGKLFSFIPRLCTTPMRGAAEWAPRYDPDHSSIRSLVKPAPNGYVPGLLGLQEQAYPGRNPRIPSQRVPKGEVDVSQIARSLPPRTNTKKRSLAALSHRGRRTIHVPSKGKILNHATNRRNLDGETKIIPGQGWAVKDGPAGYCDGTSNSVCYREKSAFCMMSGHNDARGAMKGDGLSGWLVLSLKDVKEGIFMARMESWHQYNSNKRTEGWETVNNATVGRRKLKQPPPPCPEKFTFEVAVNGVIQSSLNCTEYAKRCHYLSYNNGICLLWDDKQWAQKNEKEDVELAMRLRGEGGRIAVMAITHIYYA